MCPRLRSIPPKRTSRHVQRRLSPTWCHLESAADATGMKPVCGKALQVLQHANGGLQKVGCAGVHDGLADGAGFPSAMH